MVWGLMCFRSKTYEVEIPLLAIAYLFTGNATILWDIPRWTNLMATMEARERPQAEAVVPTIYPLQFQKLFV